MDSSEPNEVTRVVEPSSSEVGLERTAEEGEGPRRVPAMTELSQGTAFGRYIVVRKLGSGGMGVVYLAYDPQLDRGVALKVLRPGARSADREHAQGRLQREAQAMARLSHPNVVPVYDVGTVDEHVFLAMEYVDGRTLGQWLRQEQPPWPRVLDAMVAAGRGLAAAHAAGLVHRDFKPDNVMIDAQERVRVMDFGLARAAEDDAPSTQRESIFGASSSGSRAMVGLSSSASGSGLVERGDLVSGSSPAVEALTRTGFVLGTPAYMAPEQHYGAAPDPASDQFSFCVALHEALYGERPFAGQTAVDLVLAARARNVRPAPAGSRVPAWLRRAVLRGLSPDPQERWPSMDALLDELAGRRRDPSRLRAGVATLALLGAVAGGSAWLQARASAEDPCDGGEAALAETWHDAREQEVRDAFAATGLPFAEAAAGRAIEGLDAWGERWVAERRDACEATAVRHEQSDAGLDLRMRCLQGRRRAMEALLGVLASADGATVESAGQAVAGLPDPGYCADLEALAAEVPPPEDPQARQRLDDLRAALDRVDALVVAARFAEARTALDEARQTAASLDHAPARVEVGAREGVLLEAEGQLDRAVEAAEGWLWQAEALGMDRLAVQVAIDLVWLDGTERNRHERGRTWAALAGAKLERRGGEPRLRARLLRRQGDLADAEGRYDESAEHFEAALELMRTEDPGSVAYLHALGDLGKTHFRAGRPAQAAETFERAAVLAGEVLGPWHPDVAKLRGNAASALHVLGDYPRARVAFEDVLQRLEAAYGPEHLSVATVLTNLGNTYHRAGDHAAAVETGRRAIRIKEAQLGPGHPKVGMNLNNVAMAQSSLGDHEGSLASYRLAEEAMARLGAEHPSLVEPRIGQGEELMHLGRPADAIAPLEGAYALEQAHGHDPRRRALPAFMLARALWDGGGDRARAHELALDALAVLGEAPETAEDRRLLAAIRTWQAEHPAG